MSMRKEPRDPAPALVTVRSRRRNLRLHAHRIMDVVAVDLEMGDGSGAVYEVRSKVRYAVGDGAKAVIDVLWCEDDAVELAARVAAAKGDG